MEHDAKYLKMVKDPVRNAISLPTIDFRAMRRTPTIRFNCIERPMKRTKLRNNKKVAFMSGCVRFPVVKNALLTLEKSKEAGLPARVSPNIPKIVPKPSLSSVNRMAPMERLQRLPRRYELTRTALDKNDQMQNVFADLPVGRILLPDMEGLSGMSLDRVNKPFKMEMFYKDSYIRANATPAPSGANSSDKKGTPPGSDGDVPEDMVKVTVIDSNERMLQIRSDTNPATGTSSREQNSSKVQLAT